MKKITPSISLIVLLVALAGGCIIAYGWKRSTEVKQAIVHRQTIELNTRRIAAEQFVNKALETAASGKLTQGAALLGEAGNMDPTWAEPHLQRADLLGFLGKSDEARREMEEAIRLEPDSLERIMAQVWPPRPVRLSIPPTLSKDRNKNIQSLFKMRLRLR